MHKKIKTEWIEFGWSGAYPIQCIPPMKAWVFDFAKIGFPLSKMALTFHDDTLAFYVLKHEYEGHGKKFFQMTLKNPRLILSFLNQTNKAAGKIFNLQKKWNNINFLIYTNTELLRYHKQLFDIDETLWRKGQPQNLLEMGNNYLTTFLQNSLKGLYGQKKAINFFEILSTSQYTSASERQDCDFLKLAKILKNIKNKSKALNLIKNHWEKHRWINYGWTGPEVSLKTFEENFKQAIKNPKIIQELENKISKKTQLLEEQQKVLNLLPREVKIASETLRKILECKSRRTDAHSLTYFLANPLLLEIGKRLGLSLNQLRAIDQLRVKTFFKYVDADQINEEIKYVCYWFEKGKGIKKYTGDRAKQLMKKIINGLPKITKTSELKGEMAYKGKAKGKVRIILRAGDIGNFNKGEILVTAMTDPGFVPAMKKAKAVITNSGGITCHAAIISRELHIPCVIGTKIATKVFKDGDLVEVDANKGIVKKI